MWGRPDASGLYNSGTGTARTFLDPAAAVFTALGREGAMRFIDMPPTLAGRYQDFTRAVMTKFRAAGYDRPATTLEYGAVATVEWPRDRDRLPQ